MTKLIALSTDTLDRSVDAVRRAGGGNKEAAAFWLGRVDTLEVDTVIVPAGPEVEFAAFWLRITERWMLTLAEMCDQLDRIVLGALHSHPGTAFFSATDGDCFFHAPDCVSIVLPSYGDTSTAEMRTQWGVYVGLPSNKWRAGDWDDDIVLADSRAELIELQ